VTAILEAMAMGKAVICSRTRGQSDVVVDGETGLYVPPGDAATLRAAIQRLIASPEEAARMGRAGRRRVEELMSLERYAERIGGYVQASTRE
jgi:glycosyltransferase involved in cell wall biosynthesis